MQLFPERDERRDRRLVPVALLLSLGFHLLAVLGWIWLGHAVAPVVARLLPRPSPTPEIVALSDAITIERRTVPRQTRRAQPAPHARPVRPQPQRPPVQHQQPMPRTIPLPTLPPVATPIPLRTEPPPTQAPHRAREATIHHPPVQTTLAPRPREVVTPVPRRPAAPAAQRPFSPQQMAALDARFSKTIAQAQHALTNVPPQRRPPARRPDQLRYEMIMAGTPEQFLTAQGECVSIQSDRRGPFVDRYLRCTITYSDGYFEQVSFPWSFRFTRRGDPFAYEDGSYHPFPMQAPPDAFVLPHPFALSRALCSFYKSECASLIAREKAAGDQPAP